MPQTDKETQTPTPKPASKKKELDREALVAYASIVFVIVCVLLGGLRLVGAL